VELALLAVEAVQVQRALERHHLMVAMVLNLQ
jgi:hypothetical protein